MEKSIEENASLLLIFLGKSEDYEIIEKYNLDNKIEIKIIYDKIKFKKEEINNKILDRIKEFKKLYKCSCIIQDDYIYLFKGNIYLKIKYVI